MKLKHKRHLFPLHCKKIKRKNYTIIIINVIIIIIIMLLDVALELGVSILLWNAHCEKLLNGLHFTHIYVDPPDV